MATERVVPCAGLFTNPNREALPEGALTIATNLVVEQAGSAQPRPGDEVTLATVQATSTGVRRLAPYLGDLISLISEGSGFVDAIAERAGVEYTGFQGPARQTLHPYETIQARGNLYVTGTHGMQKITGLTAGDCAPAGMPRGTPPTATANTGGGATQNWRTPGNVVAYRVVFLRTDVNGYEVRGAPSGAVRTGNHNGAVGDHVILTLPMPVYAGVVLLKAGDVVEVYRSAQVDYATTEPPDDMNLVISYALTAADVAATSITLTDVVFDAQRVVMPALYTGPSQQGIDQANETPPWASDCAFGNRIALYGDVMTRRFSSLDLFGPTGWAWDTTHGALVGRHAAGATINFTLGSTTAVLTAGTANIGECVSQSGVPTTAGATVPAECIIVANDGAGNLKLSVAATLTTAAVVCVVFDTVKVGGRYYYASNNTTNSTREFNVAAGGAVTLDDTVAFFCQVVNMDQSGGVWAQPNQRGLTSADLAHGYPGVVFYERQINSTMNSTSDYTQRESLFATATLYGPQDVFLTNPATYPTPQAYPDRLLRATLPGGVYVSKQDEPEAVPVEQLLEVGDPQKRVLRMLAVREAVWVFKEDGLFRISGADFFSLSWELVDPSVTLLHSYAADVMGTECMAWTSQGVERFGDGGRANLSQIPIGASLSAFEQLSATHLPNEWGLWLLCDTVQSRVLVSTAAIVSGSYQGSAVYCHSTRTGAWSSWSLWQGGAFAACVDPSLGRAVFSSQSKPSGSALKRALLTERARTDPYYTADASETVAVTVVVDNGDGTATVTINPDPVYTPAVGDAIATVSGAYATVVAVLGAQQYLVDAVPTVASLPYLHGVGAIAQWAPFGAATFDVGKVYREARVLLDDAQNVGSFSMLYANAPDSPTSLVVPVTVTKTATPRTIVKRVGVPRNLARAQVLYAGVSLRQAVSQWKLNGVALVSSPGMQSVGR